MKPKKAAPPAKKSAPKDPKDNPAVGGQPENDQDAREAGLQSATSGKKKSR